MANQNASAANGIAVAPYTDKDKLMLDLALYIFFSTNQTLTLDLFPQIAINRWTFIVQSWDSTFNSLFSNAAQGDGDMSNAYSQVVNAVYASKKDSNYNPLTDPSFYQQCQDFLALIALDSIKLTQLEFNIVANERQRVLGFSISNFQAMNAFLKIEKTNTYDLIGLGNQTYDKWVERKGLTQQRDYFLSDLDTIKEILNIEHKINGIIVGLKRNVIRDPNLIAVSNAAIDPSSSVRLSDIYVSYNLMPFEISLENMANKYLGDVQKKYELIAINKLKAPFVDTKGERLYLLNNASASSVRVPNTYPDRYRVGSVVRVGSRLVGETTRRVLQVIDNQDNTVILFLSGETNLTSLVTAQGAYVRCYLPDTVQDFSFVRMPSTIAPTTPKTIQPSDSEIKKLDSALLAFGVDIAVDPITRDWQVDLAGNVKLAYGFTNVTQSVKNVVSTPKGTLLHHPSYGYTDFTGDDFTNNVPTKVSGDIQSAVLRDPRFVDMKINELTVSETGEILVSSVVKITGVDQYLPLNFNI